MRAWLVVITCACGGPAQTTPPAKPPTTTPEVSADAICARFKTLHDEHCGTFTDMDFGHYDCADLFRAARSGPDNYDKRMLRGLGDCMASSPVCREVLDCVERFAATTPPREPVVSVEEVCDRAYGPLASCGVANGFGGTRESCIAERAPAQHLNSRQAACYMSSDDCDQVIDCIVDATVDKVHLRACSDADRAHTVGMPKADWERRKGAGVVRYSDARSTKAAPVEVCGFPAENAWLIAASCNDGSHPIAKRVDAEKLRVGNVGSAGRCGSIVDLYRIPCPEATYDVYVDAYVCPRPQ